MHIRFPLERRGRLKSLEFRGMMNFLAPIAACTSTIVIALFLIRHSRTFGFLDLPSPRKIHLLPIPRSGGLAMFLSVFLVYGGSALLRKSSLPALPWQTSLAGIGFFVLGVLDDRYSFHPRKKIPVFLALSILAAWPWALIFKTTGVCWVSGTWANSYFSLATMSVLLICWFFAVPNAVNIEDAIDGYMGGYAFLILLFVSYRGVDTHIAMGAVFGFLVLNWPKAKHFMGDAGSYGCGFLIAEVILRADGMNHPFMALALTAPISMDVAIGLLRRKCLGMSYLTADRKTLPHHLFAALTEKHTWCATPILLMIAACFIYLFERHKIMAMLVISYAITLVVANRDALFKGKGRTR